MSTSTPSLSSRSVPLILAGPALVGAALGLQGGPVQILSHAATLPLILVGVALLMLPALYIGAAFLGVAPEARAIPLRGAAAMRDTSIILLGLVPALFFLVAASLEPATATTLGVLVVGLAAVLGLRSLYLRLFEAASGALPLFVLWSLVTFGIGGQLISQTVLAS